MTSDEAGERGGHLVRRLLVCFWLATATTCVGLLIASWAWKWPHGWASVARYYTTEPLLRGNSGPWGRDRIAGIMLQYAFLLAFCSVAVAGYLGGGKGGEGAWKHCLTATCISGVLLLVSLAHGCFLLD